MLPRLALGFALIVAIVVVILTAYYIWQYFSKSVHKFTDGKLLKVLGTVTDPLPWTTAAEVVKFPDKGAFFLWPAEGEIKDGQTILVQGEVELVDNVECLLFAIVDNYGDVYVNGKKVLSGVLWGGTKTEPSSVKLTLPTNTPSTQNTPMHTPPLPPSSRNISQPLINVE